MSLNSDCFVASTEYIITWIMCLYLKVYTLSYKKKKKKEKILIGKMNGITMFPDKGNMHFLYILSKLSYRMGLLDYDLSINRWIWHDFAQI